MTETNSETVEGINQTVEGLNKYSLVSYGLMASMIVVLFTLHLMPTFIAALIVFLMIHKLHNLIGERYKSSNAHNLTLLAISFIVVLILSLIGLGIFSSLRVGSNNIENLSGEAMNIMNQIRVYLPESLLKYIPDDVFQLKSQALDFSKGHVKEMMQMTTSSVKGIASVLLGMFIGAVVAFSFLHSNKNGEKTRIDLTQYPYVNEFMKRLHTLSAIFAKVGGAQVKISAINAVLTAIYLLIIIPILGFKIPYATTLVVCTFIFGLIPVLGNLITNTLIVLLSLMVSFEIAITSLVFLVVVHKLEYYINAKIVGSQIKTSIWELLIAMILMQAIFGVIGVVLAPVVYGYIKEELKLQRLIPS